MIKLPDGIYKLGMTRAKKLSYRMMRYVDEIENDYIVEFIIETDTPTDLERQLKAEFRHKLDHGKEYFRLEIEDKERILAIALNGKFEPEEIRPERIKSTDPRSLISTLEKLFEESHLRNPLRDITYALSGRRSTPISMDELIGSVKYSRSYVYKTIRELDEEYKFLEIVRSNPRLFMLNSHYWGEVYTKKDLPVSYGMDAIIR